MITHSEIKDASVTKGVEFQLRKHLKPGPREKGELSKLIINGVETPWPSMTDEEREVILARGRSL